MSDQHTQEQLTATDMTNEDGRVYLTIKGKKYALGIVFNLQMRGNTLNDARRLAACWNACDGLPTELLENIITLGDTLASRFKLRDQTERELAEQRDALLDALKEAEPFLALGIRKKARAAIAKTTRDAA